MDGTAVAALAALAVLAAAAAYREKKVVNKKREATHAAAVGHAARTYKLTKGKSPVP